MVLAPLTAALSDAERAEALRIGRALVTGARARADERPYLDAFLQEFGLSNPEGIALMCIAEALLRIPDDDTADGLIAEKLASGDWRAHAGRSGSLFVNASTWGLMLTGRLIQLPDSLQRDTGGWLDRLTRRTGEPLVRQALRRAVRIIGSEFVVGRDIHAALARSAQHPDLAWCSYDMLGEAARTDSQATHYFDAYRGAIEAISAASRAARDAGAGAHELSSISIKLSALDPRFALTQRERVMERLLPRALELSRLAARHGLALTIDAEEADRLEITLEVFAKLAGDAVTGDWPGLGLAVQAYGKRAPAVIDWLETLSRRTGRTLAVRLVKGAYWDTEIKRAQQRGLADYPVYTRKVCTDVAYLGCARLLLNAAPRLYPQFATHNAHTIGAVLAMLGRALRGRASCEFQRLHGMGGLLYDEAQRQVDSMPPVRTYAPVGPHVDLLAYLVRRLLENGANTSFVNRFMDAKVPVDELVADPITALAAIDRVADPALPLPIDLYGATRRNSHGIDPGLAASLDALRAAVALRPATPDDADGLEIRNPAERDEIIGRVSMTDGDALTATFAAAAKAQPDWNAVPADERAALLERTADAIEFARARFISLLVREGGKTLFDAVAEVREAVDFCRYYAAEARRLFSAPMVLPGPTGETNLLSLQGRGVMACISPWNFPLAIFAGQVVAALAAGNAVIAKPAEATPLVAQAFVAVLHELGVPREVLFLTPMAGAEFGAAALVQPALAGVVFTGSTGTALRLNRALAARGGAILPLVAETGGINAMIVDSSALTEQVVDDVLHSAFGSAGQRCSALRVLCLQDDIAERTLAMLRGAMDTLVIGNPADPATDVGPVISAAAVAALNAHVAAMGQHARILHACKLEARHRSGSFFAPHLLELHDLGQLRQEAFGPILHVLRYRVGDYGSLLRSIRSSGYNLTLGVQTRMESTWRRAFAETSVGNIYVNRGMTGAVVGVQPFGGSGLSGTGPKAGGPHYLPRLAIERTLTINTTAAGGNAALLAGSS